MLRRAVEAHARLRRHHSRRPRPVHVGRHAERVLPEQHPDDRSRWASSSRSTRARAGRPLFGGPAVDGDRAGSRVGRRRDPAVPARRRVVEPPRDRALRQLGRCADVCRIRRWAEELVPDGHELSRSFPAHAHLADVHPVGSGEARTSRSSASGSASASRRIARTTRSTTARAPRRSRRSCATRTRRWSSIPGPRRCSASARTSAKRASRRSSSSTRFT